MNIEMDTLFSGVMKRKRTENVTILCKKVKLNRNTKTEAGKNKYKRNGSG